MFKRAVPAGFASYLSELSAVLFFLIILGREIIIFPSQDGRNTSRWVLSHGNLKVPVGKALKLLKNPLESESALPHQGSAEREVNQGYWKDPTEVTREEMTEKDNEIHISQKDQFPFPPIYQKVPGPL